MQQIPESSVTNPMDDVSIVMPHPLRSVTNLGRVAPNSFFAKKSGVNHSEVHQKAVTQANLDKLLFQVSEIQEKYPALHAFLFSDPTENLIFLSWNLELGGYDLTLKEKGVRRLPLLDIIATISSIDHFKTI